MVTETVLKGMMKLVFYVKVSHANTQTITQELTWCYCTFSATDKCRLPHYGGCPFTRVCLSSAYEVRCSTCVSGFVEDPADPHGECLNVICHAASINYYYIIITRELSAYINTAEEDRFVEVCAVLDDGMIEVGQSII